MNIRLNDKQFVTLKELYVERLVDNMSTKDLVQYVTDDMSKRVDSLTKDEKKFYDDMQEKYLLGVCDKYNIVTDELVYVEYDFEKLSDKGIEECEKNNYSVLCEEAFTELMTV